MSDCVGCAVPIGDGYRYCPWCGATQEPKLTQFFNPHASIEQERGGALRVSRYLANAPARRHVRFSVWDKSGEAEAAISIDEPEARRLAGFLLEPHGAAQPSRIDVVLDWLRSSLLRTG